MLSCLLRLFSSTHRAFKLRLVSLPRKRSSLQKGALAAYPSKTWRRDSARSQTDSHAATSNTTVAVLTSLESSHWSGNKTVLRVKSTRPSEWFFTLKGNQPHEKSHTWDIYPSLYAHHLGAVNLSGPGSLPDLISVLWLKAGQQLNLDMDNRSFLQRSVLMRCSRSGSIKIKSNLILLLKKRKKKTKQWIHE